MAYSNLWSQTNYLAPYTYILDSNIIEFDIAKANISVLRSKNVISDDLYKRLYNLPKMDREVNIGRLQKKHPEITDVLKAGIQEARQILFGKLNLNDSQILSINNDAVFVIMDNLVNTTDIKIDNYISFKIKGQYRSFYNLANKQFYYMYDPISNREGMDIKGIGEFGIQRSQDFIKLLCDLFYSYLVGGISYAYTKCCKTYEDYINRKLPIECYRRLDSFANFDIYRVSDYAGFQADTIPISSAGAINPTYNAEILLTLLSYYTDAILKA